MKTRCESGAVFGEPSDCEDDVLQPITVTHPDGTRKTIHVCDTCALEIEEDAIAQATDWAAEGTRAGRVDAAEVLRDNDLSQLCEVDPQSRGGLLESAYQAYWLQPGSAASEPDFGLPSHGKAALFTSAYCESFADVVNRAIAAGEK